MPSGFDQATNAERACSGAIDTLAARGGKERGTEDERPLLPKRHHK